MFYTEEQLFFLRWIDGTFIILLSAFTLLKKTYFNLVLKGRVVVVVDFVVKKKSVVVGSSCWW